MIYALSRELNAHLQSRGCPLRVLYGPEEKQTTVISRPRVVLQRSDDEHAPRRSQHKNPKMHGVCATGAILRVFAQSTLNGAARHDHEEMAEQARDMCLVALRKIISEWKTLVAFGPAHFLSADEADLAGIERWPGVIYEMRFTVDRGIYDRTWQSEAAAEARLGTDVTLVSTTTIVNDGGEETACGE